jgi:hypothetical protein
MPRVERAGKDEVAASLLELGLRRRHPDRVWAVIGYPEDTPPDIYVDAGSKVPGHDRRTWVQQDNRRACPCCGGRVETRLLDCAGLAREYGIGRTAAEAIMRRIPKVIIEGLRKTYVKREDVQRVIDESTHEDYRNVPRWRR